MTSNSGTSSAEFDELLAKARSGDDLAWSELYRQCYPKLMRVVRRKLDRSPIRSVFDSTDFASDVMKSLVANVGRLDFESMESLVSFLAQVAEQKVIDEYRKANTLKRDITRQCRLGAEDPQGDGRSMPNRAPDPTASQVALATEAHDRLLHGQQGNERAAIELKEQGYSNNEIAEQTGWNVRKVQRFFQDLKKNFVGEGD